MYSGVDKRAMSYEVSGDETVAAPTELWNSLRATAVNLCRNLFAYLQARKARGFIKLKHSCKTVQL